MVLVVRDAGQAGVEGHHDECELGQGAQQARALPGETGLQVKLGGAKKEIKPELAAGWRKRSRLRRQEEDTHHQVEHGVHGEGSMPGEEGLPEEKQTVNMLRHAR